MNIWRCAYCRKVVFARKNYFKDDLICKSCLKFVPKLYLEIVDVLRYYLIEKNKK